MPCYRPLQAWRGRAVSPSGKRPLVFNVAHGFADMPIKVPCGQCIGCRLEHSRQWAMRCMHEASLHEENCYLTLTYREEELPAGGTLVLSDFQKFMKRLRKYSGADIKMFHCGEYGEANGRPHYHAIIFGFDFDDKVLFNIVNGHRLYISGRLSRLWPHGHSTIGAVTFESAAYVARYTLKKRTGPSADAHYERVDPDTGEIFQIKPEYATMSKGIGREWFKKFRSDCYPSDFVIVRGVKCLPPKFYDRELEAVEPKLVRRVKGSRTRRAKRHAEDQTSARLRVREKCHTARAKLLPRKGEFL